MNPQTPLILITNDDGIHSPGLHAMAQAAHPLGKLLIVAPTHQQSGKGGGMFGNKKDFLHPIAFEVEGQNMEAYHCDATPALVLEHGLAVLCKKRLPDLVISGCNFGENLGADIGASGTVGAALRAATQGIPALAISLEVDYQYHFEHGAVDWSVALHFAHYFAQQVLAHKLPPDVDVLKIDIPRTASPATPWQVTKLAKKLHFSRRLESASPTTPLEAVQALPLHDPAALEKGTDIHCFVAERLISVTPLSLDFTSRVEQAVLLDSWAR